MKNFVVDLIIRLIINAVSLAGIYVFNYAMSGPYLPIWFGIGFFVGAVAFSYLATAGIHDHR